MKRFFLLNVVLLFSLFASSQIKSGEVVYGVYLPSLTDSNGERKKISRMFEEIYNEALTIKAILKFNKKNSQFSPIKKLDSDANDFVALNALNLINFNGEFYTNISRKECLRHTTYLGEEIYVLQNLINWEITKDYKRINNFLCYKAISKKKFVSHKGEFIEEDIEAWFTPEIPFSIGPKNFYGLPGLILEVREGVITFLAENITLSEIDGYETPKKQNLNIKVITSDEYDKLIKNNTPSYKTKKVN